MKAVSRESLLDYVTYNEQRDEIRARAMVVKGARRLHIGPHLTFLFENTETIRYQVLEMLRAERIVKEADIQHELHTYNELLGSRGELGCTLMIEIETPEERDVKLREWLALPRHLYALLPDGTKVRAKFDERQVGDTRVSSVQYLKFDTIGILPMAFGCDLPAYNYEAKPTPEQAEALKADLC